MSPMMPSWSSKLYSFWVVGGENASFSIDFSSLLAMESSTTDDDSSENSFIGTENMIMKGQKWRTEYNRSNILFNNMKKICGKDLNPHHWHIKIGPNTALVYHKHIALCWLNLKYFLILSHGYYWIIITNLFSNHSVFFCWESSSSNWREIKIIKYKFASSHYFWAISKY